MDTVAILAEHLAPKQNKGHAGREQSDRSPAARYCVSLTSSSTVLMRLTGER